MTQPSEQPYPVLYCCSTVHENENRPATWYVDFLQDHDLPYCTSCHFFLKLAGTVIADRRIPVATLVWLLPGNLSLPDLAIEVEKCKKTADELGYWSPDRQFYDIKNVDNAVRLTFRRI